MNLEAQRQKERCRELLEAWGYEPTEAEDLIFDDLATGDLFSIEGEGDYRKIIPIVLPDVAPLTAALIPALHWRHVEEDRTVTRWGTTPLWPVEKARIEREDETTQTLNRLENIMTHIEQTANPS